MNIFIDARSPLAIEKIFNLSLVERILRQLNVLNSKTATVILPPDIKPEVFMHRELSRFDLKPQWLVTDEPLSIILSKKNDPPDSVIILEGDGIYDDRILQQLLNSNSSLQIIDSQNPDAPVAVKLNASDAVLFIQSKSDLTDFVAANPLEKTSTQSMQAYIRFLRKHIEPVLLRLKSKDAIHQIENELYEKTFKGGMEVIAVYGYRIPVRELTRFFAKTAVTPNMVTAAATVCKIGAIPFFFFDQLLTGLLLAFAFILLDSLDGKLARMTFRFSETADKVDHMTSMPARVGWNFGMCWHFSQGDFTSAPGIAGIIITVLPFLDDINWTVIKYKFHRSLFDLTPFDATIHLFNVKRNDTALMIMGTLAGFPLQAFYAITAWTVLAWIWHSLRTLYVVFILSKRHPEMLQ